MAEAVTAENANSDAQSEVQLERGTYEIIRSRLNQHSTELRTRLDQLNEKRRDVFGAIETRLLSTERVTTENNCVARDMVALGERFIFGYNVHIGLRSETKLTDVFAVQSFRDNAFHVEPPELIDDAAFLSDFQQIYKYYKNTQFSRFFVRGPHLYMVFQVGKATTDIKAFKWQIVGDTLKYIDARSDHEVRTPPQHEFEWLRTHRELHRDGLHPHITVEDRIFVETVGGDLTIKVEDNTDIGSGIYEEPVENVDQTLDDAEIFYAIVENLIVLKIKPYQENQYRYIVYSEKVQQARRCDAVADACVLLPQGHGLIFSSGYYLQNGEYKTFESSLTDLSFDRRIASPNGEDFLYVFYNPESGTYVLLSYNVIEQKVAAPIICHGFSLFDNGHMVFFKSGDQPQKHHALQIWQTPYVGHNFEQHTDTTSLLYKIGNQDLVRGMAECHEILSLIDKDDSYGDLYVDIAKKSTDILDSYFWVTQTETANLGEVLTDIKTAADAAIDEFEKVTRVRQNTRHQYDTISTHARDVIKATQTKRFESISDFVDSLAELRRVRGETIGLKDLRYIDLPAVEQLESLIADQTNHTSHHCVEFLLREDSLAPYEQRVDSQRNQINELTKASDAKRLEEEITAGASELEMLIDVVSNLKIDDATQRTSIIDNISAIYSVLNQVRAALKKKKQELLSIEGDAEFHSQTKLLSQAVVNYLDVCDTPERCDEYLTKVMVQIEELEGRFAEFDDFLVELSEKREEIYSAFDNRRVALVESRNKRATSLLSAAERILKGINTRVAGLDDINEIHSYFAADLMVEKVRNIVAELAELGDTVKVDDIQSQLKTIREDSVRQLKDRQELFVDGANVIQLGRHKFTVNTQPLDLTTVIKDGKTFFHLTGTNFLEEVTDEQFLATSDVWQMDSPAENANVYRSEYLAWQFLKHAEAEGSSAPAAVAAQDDDALTKTIQQFMARRHTEGYVKGVHDHDAMRIVRGLLELRSANGMLCYPARARALGTLILQQSRHADHCQDLRSCFDSARGISRLFAGGTTRDTLVTQVDLAMRREIDSNRLPQFHHSVDSASQFVLDVLGTDGDTPISEGALSLCRDFHEYVRRHNFAEQLAETHQSMNTVARFGMLVNWLQAYDAEHHHAASEFIEEAAAALVAADLIIADLSARPVLSGVTSLEITDMLGDHNVIDNRSYHINYIQFHQRLEEFEQTVVPKYHHYVQRKKQLIDDKRNELRLDEFKPRVLTSFVRNRLINDVYLPMIGDNFAKQIGAAGDQKRTDLMGLLLLISPPGYGKTTLMEYIANRLGITFVKINGPAIGHQVTSLDPAEAPNAGAREEINKLNLALEMGDNAMIYVDDIQHCNPEFLQKFISLCDGQRRIEGVYKGKTRTYDLRGRKVCVVMAGNPYTESGDKFQIPDMLANRADTYNLGDVVGDAHAAFEMSYLENALTSNPTLNQLNARSQQDVYGIIKMAELDSPDGIDLEGNYSVEELNEFVAVIKKLMYLRDVVLRVNDQYIHSAAQADAYRTEPAFKLQGSYRDMNKMAERIVPIMNDDELQSLVEAHYENAAQTLTSDAEANLLKLKQMLDTISETEKARWESIQKTFQRNTLLGGAQDDKIGQVILQMATFSDGLNEIKDAVSLASAQWLAQAKQMPEQAPTIATEHVTTALKQLETFNDNLAAIKQTIAQGVSTTPSPAAAAPTPETSQAADGRQQTTSELLDPEKHKVVVVHKVPRAFLDLVKAQFGIIQSWMTPFLKLSQESAVDLKDLNARVDDAFGRYHDLIARLEHAAEKGDAERNALEENDADRNDADRNDA